MKTILLIFLSLFIFRAGFTQQAAGANPAGNVLEIAEEKPKTPLIDAINYIDYISVKDYYEAKKILRKYFESDGDIASTNFIDVPIQVENATEKESLGGGAESGSVPGIGAPAMIDEISKIIAERFREELTLAFLDNFRKKVKADPFLGCVFPNAKNVLLFDDPFNYESWLASFRSALNQDIREIPANFPCVVDGIQNLPSARTWLDTHEDEEQLIKTAVALYEQAVVFLENPEDTYSPTDNLLSYIKTEYDTTVLGKTMAVVHPLVAGLSNDQNTNWASQATLGRLMELNVAKTYVGFTLLKYEAELSKIKIKIGKEEKSIVEWANSSSDNGDGLGKLMKQIATEVVAVEKCINELNILSESKPKLEYKDFASLIDKSTGLIELLTSESTLTAINTEITIPENLMKGMKVVNESISFVSEVNTAIVDEKYSNIIVATLSLIEATVPQEIAENNQFLKDVLKYGNLAVSLSNASTPEEFSLALKGAILPTQSYRLKRNAHFSVTANAYAGPFGAAEFLNDRDVQNPIEGMVGFTAPIGIALNWGLTKKNPPKKYSMYPTKTVLWKDGDSIVKVERKRYFSGHSLSLFASVLDVGAVTAYRLKNDHGPAANVQWKNILAPGAHVIWGIGNTPLALSVGVQYGPELRSVKAVDDATDENGTPITEITSRAWRVGGALTVDIPLFNFYSKSEKVRERKAKKCKKTGKKKD